MAKAAAPKKVKLFTGIIYKEPALSKIIKKNLRAKFGDIDFESRALDFSYTKYYEKEMGAGLKRIFFSFKKLIPPDKIAKIKQITNGLESKFSKAGRRGINLDPGYINDAKLVLATTKDYSHRLYLKNGIYAEVTLSFSNGSFKPYPWAYPDYQTKDYISIFNQIRGIFMEQRDA